MKRWTQVISACSIVAVAILFSVSAYSATEKAASPQKDEIDVQENAPASLSGKVVETMNAGGYTYVCIEKKGAKTWVAIPPTKVTVGQKVAFQPAMEMKNFKSASLNRTFASIYFSGGLLTASQGGDTKGPTAAHGSVPAPAGEKITVKKAEGNDAYTVAEIHAKRESLNEKQVIVKGKVVKVSPGIMGKNWIHIQDGTGDAAGGTNDIIATSQDSPEVGEVVTVKGTVYKDKDFGAGYTYSVIIEQASVQK